MTNIYTAIMRAADHIEQHPNIFDFSQFQLPRDCDTPGCALGWIGFFAGFSLDDDVQFSWDVMRVGDLLGLDLAHHNPKNEFYIRLDALSPGWYANAVKCAAGLHAYADKYHGHEKPQGIPESVREIFELSAEAAA